MDQVCGMHGREEQCRQGYGGVSYTTNKKRLPWNPAVVLVRGREHQPL